MRDSKPKHPTDTPYMRIRGVLFDALDKLSTDDLRYLAERNFTLKEVSLDLLILRLPWEEFEAYLQYLNDER